MKRFYYADASNQPRGPVNIEDLKALAAAGTITEKTNVFPEGAKAWVKWGEVLKSEAPPAPAPAPALPPALTPAAAPAPVQTVVQPAAAAAPAQAAAPALSPARVAAPTLITQPAAAAPAPAAAAPIQTVTTPAAYSPAPVTYTPPVQTPVAYAAPEPQPAQVYTPPAAVAPSPAAATPPSLSAAASSPAPAPVIRSGPPSLPAAQPAAAPATVEPIVSPYAPVSPYQPQQQPVQPQSEPEPVISLDDPAASADPATAWLESPSEPARQSSQSNWPIVDQTAQQPGAAVTPEPVATTSTPPSLAPAETSSSGSSRRPGPRMRRETRDTLSGSTSTSLTTTGANDASARSAAKAREQLKQMQSLSWGAVFWGLVLVLLQCFTIPWTLITNAALTLSTWGKSGTLPTKESDFPALTFMLVVIRPCIHLVFTVVGILGSIVFAFLPLLSGNMTAFLMSLAAIPGGIIATYFLNLYLAIIFESGALLLSIYTGIRSIDRKTEDKATELE